MSPDICKVRSPSELDLLFYKDLLAPLQAYAAPRWTDPSKIEELKLLRQRFSMDIRRYGYVLTQRGVMVRVEPDILDTSLDAAHSAMLRLGMQILDRLTKRF